MKDYKTFANTSFHFLFKELKKCVHLFFICSTFILPILPFFFVLKFLTNQSFDLFYIVYLISISFCFFVPSIYLLQKPGLRNPFFVIPFIISFCLGFINLNWSMFFKDWLIWLGFLQLFLGLLRTPRPWNGLLVTLKDTKYFKNYPEIHIFWRIIVVIICPIFIPFIWILCTFIAWS